MRQIPTAPVAAGSLIAGYAVAAGTGVRPLGGLVLLAGGGWCVAACARRRGWGTAAALGAVGVAAFAVSHPLGHAIGAWPAVLTVSAVTAALAWIFVDSRGPHPAAPAPSVAR